MTYAERIQTKLSDAFSPAELDVRDDSHKHKGHVGARPEGETHFHVRIVSEAFQGQNRVNRQRAIYKVLKAELDERVHALSLEVLSPDEA